jgi:hypothetical protein
MTMAAEVHYYVAGRLLLVDLTDQPPRKADEIGIEGRVYEAVRVVRHLPMCPPDVVNVHLQLRVGEELNPSARVA